MRFVKFFAGAVLAHELSNKHEFPKTIQKHCYFLDFGKEDMAFEALSQDINAENMTKSLGFVSFLVQPSWLLNTLERAKSQKTWKTFDFYIFW